MVYFLSFFTLITTLIVQSSAQDNLIQLFKQFNSIIFTFYNLVHKKRNFNFK